MSKAKGKTIFFNCEKCGDVKHMLVEGYPFGDRLLEGVQFKVTNENGVLSARVTPECMPYFKQLNMDMWYKACIRYVKDSIIDAGDFVGNCMKCKEEGVFVDKR